MVLVRNKQQGEFMVDGEKDPVDSTDLKNETPNAKVDQVEMVPKSELAKAIDDIHVLKNKLKEQDDVSKNKEIDDLKEKENWKQIAKIKEDEAATATSETKNLRESIVQDKKFAAMKEAALGAGIRKEALGDLDLLDFSELIIETTNTGKINVLGCEKAISNLKAQKPHWFTSRSTKVDGGLPEVINGGGVTYKDVLAAEQKAKETSDYVPYKKVLQQYREQH